LCKIQEPNFDKKTQSLQIAILKSHPRDIHDMHDNHEFLHLEI
jgi:hypothetical protein